MFLIVQESKAVVKVHAFTSRNTQFSGDPTLDPQVIKYNYVHIYCNPYSCDLRCEDESDFSTAKTCSWDNVQGCFGCLNNNWNDLFWNPSNASELYDDAIDEITLGNYSGNYSLNYINSSNNITYYRTVSWEHNITTNISTINITISYDDGL
jgi:hypothetical protein